MPPLKEKIKHIATNHPHIFYWAIVIIFTIYIILLYLIFNGLLSFLVDTIGLKYNRNQLDQIIFSLVLTFILCPATLIGLKKLNDTQANLKKTSTKVILAFVAMEIFILFII